MSELTQPQRPIVAPPVKAPPPKTIAGLRKEYESLAAKCTEAANAGDQPETSRLKEEKKVAHAAWHNAVVAERHALRDSDRARGRKPGIGV